MTPQPLPALQGVDHLHVFVADRPAAAAWYARVLGMTPIAGLAHWAADGGPLTIRDADDRIHLALFERARQANRSTIALRVAAGAWPGWQAHLRAQQVSFNCEDHGESWSIYFDDPDGNPYEITCYEVAALRGASHDAISH